MKHFTPSQASRQFNIPLDELRYAIRTNALELTRITAVRWQLREPDVLAWVEKRKAETAGGAR